MDVNKSHILKSAFSMSGFSLLAGVLSILQISITARFVSPKEFGIFAFAGMILTLFTSFLRAIPLGLIKTEKPSYSQIYNVQKFCHFAAISFFLITLLIGAFVQKYLNKEGFLIILSTMALSLFFLSFEQVRSSLITKELEMTKIALAKSVALIASFFVTVYLAFKGYGVWALVSCLLINSFVETILIRVQSNGLIKRDYQAQDSYKIIKFGFLRGIDQSILVLTQKIDQYFIGIFLGNSSLGLYSVSSNLAKKPFDLINPVLGGIIFPVYSKVQNNERQLEYYWSSNMKIFAIAFLILGAFLSVFSELLTDILLGENWLNADIIFSIIFFGLAFHVMGMPIRQIAQVYGFNGRLISYNVISAFTILIPLVILSSYSKCLILTAYIIVVSKILLYFFSFYYLLSGSKFRPYKVLKQILLRTLFPLSLFICSSLFYPAFLIKLISFLLFVIVCVCLNLDVIHKNISLVLNYKNEKA